MTDTENTAEALEEQNAELSEKSREFAASVEETCDDLIIPIVKEISGYEGNISVNARFSARLVEDESGTVSADISDTVLSLVFNDPTPDSYDMWATAEETAKRLLAEAAFKKVVEMVAQKR